MSRSSDRALDRLHRIRRWEVDEAKRTLSSRMREADAVAHQISAFEREVATETEATRTISTDVISVLGPYTQRTMIRRHDLDLVKESTERSVEEARNKLRDHFVELKRLEIALENSDARERHERARLNRSRFDEIAISTFRRGH